MRRWEARVKLNIYSPVSVSAKGFHTEAAQLGQFAKLIRVSHDGKSESVLVMVTQLPAVI